MMTRFRKDETGVAAVEAALILPVFLLVVVVCVDFSLAFRARTEMASALTLGAQYAVQVGATLTPTQAMSTAENIRAAVRDRAQRVIELNTTIKYNGSENPSAFEHFNCVSGVVLQPTGMSPKPCGDGTVSGRFMTIEVSGHLPSFFGRNPIYGQDVEVRDRITVRLQ